MLLDNIRALCAGRHISISALETEVQLGKNTVYRWGTLFPSVDKVQRVADYFGVTVDALLKDGSDLQAEGGDAHA